LDLQLDQGAVIAKYSLGEPKLDRETISLYLIVSQSVIASWMMSDEMMMMNDEATF
jgi:hypothetical protein